MSDRWPDKSIVGLTGNIATGKSTVMRLAEERSALALDADGIVHQILATDPGAQREIIETFGESVLGTDGAIDRAAVAAIVFNDEVALRQLEQILHPRVRRRLFRQIDRSANEVVFIEAIKLLEGGLSAECDEIWVTRCPESTQVERLMTFRHLDEETALMRVKAQSSPEIKVAAADVVIETGGTLDETRAHFELAWAGLQRRRALKAELEKTASDVPAAEPGHWQADDDRNNGRATVDRERPAVAQEHQPAPRNYNEFGPDISVSRARPDDVPAMTALANRATHDMLTLGSDEPFSDLGERGYLIGRQAEEMTAVAGWSAENLVATVDCLYVYPPEALAITGAALLHEIETTANELICEVIIALPGDLSPAGIRQLLKDMGFSRVDPQSLPQAWQVATEGEAQPAAAVMLKVLRDTRQSRVRTMKENDG